MINILNRINFAVSRLHYEQISLAFPKDLVLLTFLWEAPVSSF